MEMIMYSLPAIDYKYNMIKIGTRVRILCKDDKQFFNKIGVVKLIAPSNEIFVQMVTSGGGIWWHGQHVRIQPALRKPHKNT